MEDGLGDFLVDVLERRVESVSAMWHGGIPAGVCWVQIGCLMKCLSHVREPIQVFRERWPVIRSWDSSNDNHAAALALAAKLRGIPDYIVMPNNAPKCKYDNVKHYGGHVIWSEATYLSRVSAASKVQQETCADLVHPFNDKRTISGQGTISLELLEHVPELDTIIVSISGAGLISGVALVANVYASRSSIANMILFAANVYASRCGSLAIIASTVDSEHSK